jgi:hypothetical protein
MACRRAAVPAALLAAATLVAVGFNASIVPEGSREGKNLARGKQVLGTFSDPQRMTDGEKGGDRHSESGSAGETDQYLIVSLGQPQNIHSVAVTFAEGGIPRFFDASTSRDLVVWEDAPGRVDVKGKTSIFRPGEKTALFLKIVFPKGCAAGPVRIVEIEASPEELSDIRFSEVKKLRLEEHEVEFEWETDVEVQTIVRLGLAEGSFEDREVDASFSRDHRCLLKGLLKGTDYYARIVAIGPGGFRKETSTINFRTAGIPLPIVGRLRTEEVTTGSAAIAWEANVPVRCEIAVTGEAFRKVSVRGKKLETSHGVKLSGLRGSTPFTVRIEAVDRFGNRTSAEARFSSAEDNRALGKVPEGTYVRDLDQKRGESDREILGKVTDGDLNARTGTAVSFNVSSADQYATVDLGREIAVDRVEVYWRAVAYPIGYRVDASPDGKEWALLAENLSAEGIPHFLSRGNIGDPVIAQVVRADGRKARYLRVFAAAGTKVGTIDPRFEPPPVLMLAELKVFPVPEGGRLRIQADYVSEKR